MIFKNSLSASRQVNYLKSPRTDRPWVGLSVNRPLSH